jgi:hypothetical protein
VAQKVQTLYIDDPSEAASTVPFGFDGVNIKDRGRVLADIVAQYEAATGR